MPKIKLTGYNKIAIIRQRGRDYAYALYDNNVKAKDKVCVDGAACETIWTVSRVIPATEENIKAYNPTREVVCKIDTSAYRRRKKARRDAAKLEKNQDQQELPMQLTLNDI